VFQEQRMKTLVRSCLAAATLAGLSGVALAQQAAPPANSARAQCRAQVDSRSLTGPERKAFMHQCLGGAVAEAH